MTKVALADDHFTIVTPDLTHSDNSPTLLLIHIVLAPMIKTWLDTSAGGRWLLYPDARLSPSRRNRASIRIQRPVIEFEDEADAANFSAQWAT